MNPVVRFISLCLCIGILAETGLCVKFPKTFKRCKVGKELDGKPNPCLSEAVEDAVHQLSAESNSDLNAMILDPLPIKNIYLEKGEQSPVAIKLNFTDNLLSGLSITDIKSVSGKISTPKDYEMHMDLKLPVVTLAGPYTIAGKILILPIQGDGKSNITMQDVTCKVILKSDGQMKNGKEYMKLKDFRITIEPNDLYINLGNLFNGDKALGDNMNSFLNENWKLIYPELKGPLEDAFSAIFFEYSRRIMDRIPFNQIFITN